MLQQFERQDLRPIRNNGVLEHPIINLVTDVFQKWITKLSSIAVLVKVSIVSRLIFEIAAGDTAIETATASCCSSTKDGELYQAILY